ncbi:hypothetical protein NHJ13734_000209 [Beauveria thailandica]
MVDKLETAEEDAMADSHSSESQPKLAICIRCEKAFSIDDNEDYDCLYHYGDLYPDEGHPAWDDHDVRSHGEIDTPRNRKNFPEAFLRDCCDEHSSPDNSRYLILPSKLAAAPSAGNGSDQAICVQCNQAFSVLTRAGNSCRYHPGTRWADPSNEAWDDHYVNTDGPMETEENMEEWPDAFVWDCCQ